jgi:hypothetical protein
VRDWVFALAEGERSSEYWILYTESKKKKRLGIRVLRRFLGFREIFGSTPSRYGRRRLTIMGSLGGWGGRRIRHTRQGEWGAGGTQTRSEAVPHA